MFIICVHNDVYMPNPGGSLDIAVKPEAKCRFHSFAMLPIYTYSNKMSKKDYYYSKIRLIITYMLVRDSDTSHVRHVGIINATVLNSAETRWH